MRAPTAEGIDARAATPVDYCARCSHNRRRHELPGFAGECVSDGCRCGAFLPRTQHVAIPASPPRLPSPRSDLAVLVEAGKRSASKRTRAVAERVETFAADLHGRLRAEREQREAQEALAAAKTVTDVPMPTVDPLPAEDLVGAPNASPLKGRELPADKTCPECGKSGLKQLGAHRRFAHGYRRAAS